MSIEDTPFLSESEADELFRLMSEKSKTERRELTVRTLPSPGPGQEKHRLTPRELLNLLKRV